MHREKKRNLCKRLLANSLIVGALCSLFLYCDIESICAAPNGQTASSDVLNVKLTTSGSTAASMGGLSEGTYTETNSTIGAQAGRIVLDNNKIGGRMHPNIGQTIDMYAPSANVDYTDKIGYSGNYTFLAIGGKGGNISALDYHANLYGRGVGGYGSAVTYNSIDYNTGQSITYRKGSNGRDVAAKNHKEWGHYNSEDDMKSINPMGEADGLLYGQHNREYSAYTATAQVGTGSYIQVGGNTYIVAGGGAPGAVLFEAKATNPADKWNCATYYTVKPSNGAHADVNPALPGGYAFYNPSAANMSKRYHDYAGTGNVNAGRIAGMAVKSGCRQHSMFGGGIYYVDMFYGWITDGRGNLSNSLSSVYPGYSGCATRNGNVFTPSSAISVKLNTGITSSTPTCQLKCNAKYVTINHPTRKGYIFTGWTCDSGVSVAGKTGSSYKFKVTKSNATITANWKSNSYTITFNGNGADGGSTPTQTCNMEMTHTLHANGFTRTGYTFAGWAMSPDGDVVYADKAEVLNLTTKGNGNVNLYAKWNPVEYSIVFDSNGGTGSMDAITTKYDIDTPLPDGALYFQKYTKDGVNVTDNVLSGEYFPPDGEGTDAATKTYASIFLGWALEEGKDRIAPQWKVGENVRNLATVNGSAVTLYAVWDDCPWIQAEDLYYTLQQAQNGEITYDELIGHATAEDREDGSPILPGYNKEKGTMFWIPDYQETDFTQFRKSGSVTETYRVQDHTGNVYQKMITVHLVDTTPEEVQPETVTRFINEHYYNQPYERGGLEENSVWKTNPEYSAVLERAFENLRNDMPRQTCLFSHEAVLEMKEYMKMHGLENGGETGMLKDFYARFVVPNLVK